MDESVMFSLMVDLHREGARQGPGSDADTLRALELSRINPTMEIDVADIGCGKGASTLALARELHNAKITAVDLFPEFLQLLSSRADESGIAHRINIQQGSMESLPFADDSLDLIWSEGAIYNMGFVEGIAAWKRFLRREGVLAVSEITWLRPDPPEPIKKHWESEYPEIATASEKISILERAGYDLLGYFVLPSSSWIENYYEPTEARIGAFLERHADMPEASELIELERQEVVLYNRYREYFSYGFYVAKKR